MSRINRRTLLAGGGAAALAAATATAQRGLAPGATARSAVSPVGQSAELIVRNAAIVTMDDRRPAAEALAVRGGRILAVGSNAEIAPFLSRSTRVIDAAGAGVSPGLIDAHSHLIAYGQMELNFVKIRPPEVHSFATLNRVLAAAAAQRPKGQWIIARGFGVFAEGRFPRREELDAAVPDHPVLAIQWSGQYGVANTLALKLAGLFSADVKDPYGGKFLRDRRTNLPNGALLHYPAIYAVYQPELGEAEQLRCGEWAAKQFAAEGVTCVHDNFLVPKYAPSLYRLEQQGRLPCRVRAYPYIANLEQCQQVIQKLKRYQGPLVRVQGVKLAVDGYALMYSVPPQHQDLAIPMHPQPLFEQIVATIHRAGYQVDVHAVGDKGVDWTLEAFFKAAGSPAECRRRRHRIEHFPFRKADSIERAASLGAPVCPQPCTIDVRADDFDEKLGAGASQYIETAVPLRSFAKAGVPLALGADVPAFPSRRPMDSIRTAMERKTGSGRALDSSEALNFLEALRCHTLGSAYAAFDEDEFGSLTPGKAADFVIWARDLRTIATGAEAAALKPRATFLGGKAVYQA